jgi:hypothetical protein
LIIKINQPLLEKAAKKKRAGGWKKGQGMGGSDGGGRQ